MGPSPAVTRRSLLRRTASLGALPVLAGCSSLFGTSPTEVAVGLSASESVNPNAEGAASPVVVVVYELKSTDAFLRTGLFDLLDSDAAKLGADLLGKREFELRPGETAKYTRAISDDARHIGVVAAFRDINNATWRHSVAIKPNTENEIAITIDRLAVKADRTGGGGFLGLF